MSQRPELTIAGDTDLAGRMARHALSSGAAESVFLWRDAIDQHPGQAPVIIVADSDQRDEFAIAAVQAEVLTVSLPIPDLDDGVVSAIEQGRLHQVSSLHGNPTLARLLADYHAGRVGRRYGIFAAHRFTRNHAGDVREALNDLLVYVATLCGRGVTSVRTTSASFGGQETDAWFVLARFADDTVVTVEVAAVLPVTEESTGRLLIEVTGSDAVLRADPERQSVVVNAEDRSDRYRWYEDPAGPLLAHCLRALRGPDTDTQRGIVDLLRTVPLAVDTDQLARP